MVLSSLSNLIFLTVSSQANWIVLKHYTRCVIVLQFFKPFLAVLGAGWHQVLAGWQRTLLAVWLYGLAGWQRTLAGWLWIFS
jgi:flagellar biosynthesis protein FliP